MLVSNSLAQAALVALPADRRIFLEGISGTGKTTAGVARLLRLLAEGVPADAILVLTPQRTLAAPFTEVLRGPATRPLRRYEARLEGDILLIRRG